MTQALHIVRKDLKHLRWLLLVWVAMLAARVGFWSLGLHPRGDVDYAFVLNNATALIGSLQMLMLAFLGVRLIHAEAPVGWNAFWLTRPYSRPALIAAKLLFAAVVFVVMPMIADLGTMGIYHAGVRAQMVAGSSFISGYVTWMLLVLAIAALTPTLSAFILTFVAGFTGMSVLLMAMNALSIYLREPASAPVFRQFDPAPGIVATVVAAVALLGAIAYQYRTRRRRTAAALVVSAFVASMAIPSLWAVERRSADDVPAWAQNPAASPAVVEPRWQLERPYVRGGPRRVVFAPVRVQGMPRDYTFNLVDGESTFTQADGTVLTRPLSGFALASKPDDAQSGFHGALRQALGEDVAFIRGANEGDAVYWPRLLDLSADEYASLRGKSGRLAATLRFRMNRTRLRAILPIEAGAAHDDGLSRVEIVKAEQGPAGFAVTVRAWRALSPVTDRDTAFASYNFLLYNAARGDALSVARRIQLPTPQSGTGVSMSGGSALLRLFSALTLGMHRDGFSLFSEELAYPDRIDRPGEARTFDPDWVSGTRLAVIETANAGTVTRSVTIDDFVVPSD